MVSIELNKRIREFVKKYGQGDKKLTKLQKNNRIEKILGTIESDKILGIGKDKNKGIKFFISRLKPIEGAEGVHDSIPKEVINNLNLYPDDIRASDKVHKIIDVVVKEDGSAVITGIIKNGKETNSIFRCEYSVIMPNDKSLSRLNKNNYNKKELKEVNDRTLAIHKEDGDLDSFESDPDINTEPDTEIQY